MKKIIFLSVLIVCLFPVRAYGIVLIDDCVLPQDGSWYTYRNFEKADPVYQLEWETIPDKTALFVKSTLAPASVVYAVSGAETIVVSSFVQFSTIATMFGENYRMGFEGTPDFTQMRRMKLSQNKLLLEHPQSIWKTISAQMLYGYIFDQIMPAPPEGAVDYGVSVLYSKDGRNFQLAPSPPVLTQIRNAGNEGSANTFYYEQYTCTVPKGVTHIRVELNEVGLIPLPDGGVFVRQPGTMRLASVKLIGDALTTGDLLPPPPPFSSSSTSFDIDLEVSVSDPDGGSDSDSDSASGSASSEKSSAKSSEKSSTKSSSRASSSKSSKEPKESKEASSKQIPQIQPISRPQSTTPSLPAAPEPPPAAPEALAPPAEPLQVKPRDTSDSDMKTTVVGGSYIVFALSALAVIARKK